MNAFDITDADGNRTKEYDAFMSYIGNLPINNRANAYKQRYNHAELQKLLNLHCYDVSNVYDIIYGGEPDEFGNPGPYFIDKWALIGYIARTSLFWRNSKVSELRSFIEPIFRKYNGREYSTYSYASNVVSRIVKRCG